MPVSVKTRLSALDFAALPSPEYDRYELVEGELVAMPTGNPQHASTRQQVEVSLVLFFRKNPIGKVLAEMSCRLNSNHVRIPDVAVFLGENAKMIDPLTSPIPFPPDIAIEVLSPSELSFDSNAKVRHYLEAGVKEVWSFDYANRQVMIQTETEIRRFWDRDVVSSPLLPGYEVKLDELLVAF
jgi:Uma2 family endonuclease